ncbi:MAG: hypothetical protein WCP77_18485, partial [Roseococcus sp.]
GEEVCAHAPRGLDSAGRPLAMPPQNRLNDGAVYSAFMNFRAALSYTPTVEIRSIGLDARWSRQGLDITLQKGIEGVFYTVLLVPREVMNLPGARRLAEDGALRALVMPRQKEGEQDQTTLHVSFERPGFYTFLYWRVFVLPCLPRDGAPHVGIGYAEENVLLTGRVFAALLGISVTLLILGALGMAAYAINAWQLDPNDPRMLGQKPILLRFSPIFICQDAFGHASLARFQVLLFTLVLLGVYAYAFAASQSAPNVSGSVLALAGITLAGSTLAAAASKPSLESANRLWLNGTGVVPRARRVPRWHDLIASEGEVDITRMQALGFSLFAAVAVIFQGAENLDRFEIPEQLNYLIGLSQAVYVAGKALPVDSLRRLNEDLSALRVAERQAMGKPEDSSEFQEFMRIKAGIAVSLADVFGDGLNQARLAELKPGGRVDPAPVPIPPPSPAGFAPA